MTQLQSEDSNKQFMHFGLTGAVVDTLSWAFFSILIYKEVGGIESILLSTLLMYLGIYTSFTIMSFLVDRLGYLQAYRFSMIFHCIVAAIFAISLPNLAGIYLIMSFLRGLSSGTYWPIRHSYVLKDIHKEERSSAINTLQSSVIFIEAILPILAGALISYTGNYYATFSLASIIYLLSAFYPFKFNSKSVSKISSTEITRILKQPNIWRFLLLKFFHSTIETIIVTLISIIPFIFIKSEFGVGALASAVGITVALFSFAERKNRTIYISK